MLALRHGARICVWILSTSRLALLCSRQFEAPGVEPCGTGCLSKAVRRYDEPELPFTRSFRAPQTPLRRRAETDCLEVNRR